MKINRTDVKMIIYFLVVSIFLVILRIFSFQNYIPQNIRYYVGFGIALAGMLISWLEKRDQKPVFYSWANNWDGIAFANSGLVFAIAIFILCDNFVSGFVWIMILAILQLVFRNMVDNGEKKEGIQ